MKESKDTKKAEETLKNAYGLWTDIKETGQEYQTRIRKQWKRRQQAVNW